jgi:ubiquinone/menaquinone biosynthesis C-methylase UbiE
MKTNALLKTKTKQSEIFLNSEGDCYFLRNNSSLRSGNYNHGSQTLKRVLGNFKKQINEILEIGCANGKELDGLCAYFRANGAGVDPSSSAVNDGKKFFKKLDLKVGTATNLPHKDSAFDLVYFGFCLYLVDRQDIFKAVSEADRVLREGGFLAILDFDPKQRLKRDYHHKSGLSSFKNSYADFFTAGGHYYLVAKESVSHGGNYFSPNSDERVSITILYKETDAY